MNRYKKFLDDCKIIENYYDYLINLTSTHNFVGSTNEWIIDNYYIIAEFKVSIAKILKENKKLKKELIHDNKLYDFLFNFYNDNNYSIDNEMVVNRLNDFQNEGNGYFKYITIEAIPIMLPIVIINRLAKLCISKRESQIEKQKVRDLVSFFGEKIKCDERINLRDYISIDKNVEEHPEVIEQLNDSLQRLGESSSDIFKDLDEMLTAQGLVLKDIINKEHNDSMNNNILVANIFNSLRNILKLKGVELIDKISKTEQVLKKDPYYKKMTLETKGLYREAICKKSNKVGEYDYACHLLEKSSKKGEHIGIYLFPQPNYKLRSITYIISLLLLTIIISVAISLLIPHYKIMSFILLLVPISELIKQLLDKILLKAYRCKPLPKIDFSRGIDNNNQTIVVVPTIIKSTDKLDRVFASLEKYYLANRTDNLYFALLADCSESSTQELQIDKEIAEYGLKKSIELNDRYAKDIFSFIYRRRVYSKSERSYLGYERKRGALIHFNKLILGKLTKDEKNKYIYCENASMLQGKIKYVITLDVDTELVLNAALSLVGVMAHPLNKPILNKEKTKVISGYGIIQPRVNIDIESTNKSTFSQIMAGVGGFDVYSSIIPNFYQDVFGEGSFVGKGIYDLKVFDEVLSNTFEDNLILSHDLLEGNYLRCGYASDVELIDDYPSEFLVESSRQHRWARGDVQITGWLFNRVKNKDNVIVNNPLNLIERFKIFDNIRRLFVNPCILLLLLVAPILQRTLLISIIMLLIVCLPMIFYIKDLVQRQNKQMFTFKYYNKLLFGFISIFFRTLISFITIPYYSYLYLDAFIRSKIRMHITHKRLLNWLTAEEAAKVMKKDLTSYIIKFWPNYIASILLAMISVIYSPPSLIINIPIMGLYLSAPIILWLFSKGKDISIKKLSTRQEEKLKSMAYNTWKYFDDLLKKENHYLIPDNIQLNREEQEDYKTSPTDIGMSIISIVSANELGLIDDGNALNLLNEIITTIEKLEKWNGHLFNWYNIKTLEKMLPFEVSSVDSGNLAASLIVAKEFSFGKHDLDLSNRISNLFDLMDFSKLYTDQDVFSIAYNLQEDKLSVYNYNKFASESRILSFIAIMKGDVPSKHWLCLDKTLTKYKKHKGVVSWSGTSFEYFMPLIFMRTYPNTLLDESYFFCEYCQKNYINEIDGKLPWGISESAYDELDDGLNYKYKAFATPYLRVIDEKNDRLVISPYASALAITKDPVEVYHNLRKFQKMNMYDEQGFFESYDYKTKNRVLAHYAHHQGMILASLTNYLKDNIIQKYFHEDLRTQAFEILLKEKVQFNPVIDMKIVGYKKYDYEREKIANDIRGYNYISETPQLSILSNSHYTVLINDRGNGFSRYNTIQLNRYRKITEQDYGTYLYIRDLDTGNYWSNTFAPTNVIPEKYNVVFANDRIKFKRLDHNITTQTEIIVTQKYDVEIRKYTIKNNSKNIKKLELTTYNEVILEENIEDINHRSFKNLFVSSDYDQNTNTLIMRRRNNSKRLSYYSFGKLLVPNKSVISYETERSRFIGRGHHVYNPISIDKKLSNQCGTNLDPILSLRTNIELKPDSEAEIYYINGFSKSLPGVYDIVNKLNDKRIIDTEFDYAGLSNSMLTKLLDINGSNIRVYNIMLNYLYQTSRHFVGEERNKLLAQNKMNQSNLWRFGISGDRPIILVDIHSGEAFGLAKDTIKAYEYFKSKGIYIDLVIINGEHDEYQDIVKKEVDQELFRIHKLFDFNGTPGKIYLLSINDLSWDEIVLLNMVARLSFHSESDSSLEDAVNKMHLENKIIDFPKRVYTNNFKNDFDNAILQDYNGYGGFNNDGSEYVITNNNTPSPWSNVLANPRFGSIITNNECGFTYAYNSQMFKLSSWTNDIVVNDKSEGISINGVETDPIVTRHGFGYSIFEHKGNNYNLTTKQFVSKEDTIKFYYNKITNNTSENQNYHITFWINPTLGPNEEKSSRYLLTHYNKKLNAITIRNVYNIHFANVIVFMNSNIPISDVSLDRIIYKSIGIDLELLPGEEKTFTFTLGTVVKEDELQDVLSRYSSNELVAQELESVKEMWRVLLGTIKINTSDNSFNRVINGWYLYQTIASRMFAKAGFYQVGGAYGFRDQLQDAMNICEINSNFTKAQIIINAKHQFPEGDVLHWWHEDNHFGLRSKYMDDFLWLVLATIKYINITNDYKILQEEIPFVNGDKLAMGEDEKGITYNYTNDTKPLLEHLLLSINRTIDNTGSNNLPLMSGGDWNDGMNKVGILGKGTSVWLGFFAYDTIANFIKMCDEYNIDIDKDKYVEYLSTLKDTLNTIAWDGEYYIRAFYDDGNKIGSKECDECKIDLISQSYSILSGVIPFERIGQVIKSVEDNLVDQNLKIIKLLDPPFKNSINIPGYIMDYPKGIRENGGEYTHAAAWYIKALLKAGYTNRAYNYYQMINPINRSKNLEEANTYSVEPYVIAADIYSNYEYPGHGGWTWYTGSAGWFYNIGLTDIIGLRLHGNILSIKPNAPSEWKDFEIVYKYVDTTYKIKVNLKQDNNSVMMDGDPLSNNEIRLKNDKRIHAVIVNIKGGNSDD